MGVIVASSVVGLLQVYSSYQEDRRAIELLDKNNTILSEINRTLNPLQGLTAEVLLTADWSVGRLKEYFTDFDRSFPDDITVFGWETLPKPLCGADVKLARPVLRPGRSCEKGLVIYDVFCAFDLVLLFYKEHISTGNFRYEGSGESHGEDLKIKFGNLCSFTQTSATAAHELEQVIGVPEESFLDFDVREGQLRRLDFRMIYDNADLLFRNWYSNSRTISLHDLMGSQLIIQMHVPFIVTSAERHELLRSVILRQLVLKLPQGIFLSFNTDNLTRHQSEDEYDFYSLIFPDTLDDLLELTSYDEFSYVR